LLRRRAVTSTPRLGILMFIISFAGAVIVVVGFVGLIRVTVAVRRQQS
jgi:hypothetical protein